LETIFFAFCKPTNPEVKMFSPIKGQITQSDIASFKNYHLFSPPSIFLPSALYPGFGLAAAALEGRVAPVNHGYKGLHNQRFFEQSLFCELLADLHGRDYYKIYQPLF
jgi:hypothetical protein